MPDAQPRQVALSIVKRLRSHAHVAYFAGGCVRDELLGLTPKDYDIATDATPETVAGLFRRVREVGKSFGVTLVSSGGVTVEVSTFRREQGYSDNRRPDAVEFCDARSDSRRRDFTINALFIDPLDTDEDARGRVIDFVGGLNDLRAGLVRAVGDPSKRLAEDHLRALRAVRFTARLGFTLEEATRRAIMAHAVELAGVSRERIGDEMRMMLSSGSRAEALALLEALTLDRPILTPPPPPPEVPPEVPSAPLAPPPGYEARRSGSGGFECVKELPAAPAPVGLVLAAWAADRLGEETPGEVFGGIADAIADRWRRAMCLSNEETVELRATLAGVGVIESEWGRGEDGVGGQTVAKRKRAASSPWFEGALLIVRGRRAATAARVLAEVRALASDGIGLAPRPLVTGDDLIGAGLAPGPRFGRWLERAYDEQLEGRIGARGEAISAILGWASGEPPGA